MAAGVVSPTALNILAGIAGSGGTPSLAHFAPAGTTLPATESVTLAAAFLNAGLVAETGAAFSTTTNTNDINAFGIAGPARRVKTSQIKTGKIMFRETNLVTLAIFNDMPLPGAAGGVAMTLATAGTVALTEGPMRSITYVASFTMTDGLNIVRYVCPFWQVTDKDDEVFSMGNPLDHGVTFTVYPDAAGNSVYKYYLVPNLATS